MSFRLQAILAPALLMIAASPALGQSFLDRLESAFDVQPPPPAAEPAAEERGYLGLLAEENDRKQIIVVEVDKGGPAEKAGIIRGDRILQIEGRALSNLDNMAAALDARRVGEAIEIKFARNEAVRTAKVVLDRQSSALEQVERRFDELPPPPAPPPAEVIGGAAFLGVRTEPITAALRDRYSLAIDRGAVIVEVTRGSPADQARLPVGAAIVGIDRQQVIDPKDLASAIRSMRGGSVVEVSYYQGRQLVRTRVTLGTAQQAERPLLLDGRNPPLETPPPPEPPLGEGILDNLPRFDDQRPAGRLLNRVIEGTRQPNQPLPPEAGPIPVDRRVELLEATIDRLERRIAELESRLKRIEP